MRICWRYDVVRRDDVMRTSAEVSVVVGSARSLLPTQQNWQACYCVATTDASFYAKAASYVLSFRRNLRTKILSDVPYKTGNFKRENLGTLNPTFHVTDLRYLCSSRCMHCAKFLYRCEADICSSGIYAEYISISQIKHPTRLNNQS